MKSNWEASVDKLVRRKIMKKGCPRTMRAASALITNLGKRAPPHPRALATGYYSQGAYDKCAAIEKKVAKAATAAFGQALAGNCKTARKHLKGALRMDRTCRRRKTGSKVGRRRRLRSFVEGY